MLRRYQRTIGDLTRLLDAALVTAAWLIAYWWRFHASPFAVTRGIPDFGSYAALSPLIVVLWLAVFTMLDVYDSRRMVDRAAELVLLLKANGAAMLLFIAITYLFEDYKYSRLVMATFGTVSTLATYASRLVIRGVLRQRHLRGRSLRRLIAVGEGPLLEWLVSRLDAIPELGLQVIGVVTRHDAGSTFRGKPVLGDYDSVAEVVSKAAVDEVLLAFPPSESLSLERTLDLIQDETVELRLVPDLQRYSTIGCQVEDFDGVPVVRLNDSPLIGGPALAKRATDFCLALAALICLTPLLSLIALAVKLTSSGPILYRQERMGLDGRTFQMMKFRSMRVDAEDRTGAIWARAGDDRRTPIGAFLRATSLDELPQFWHVLRGEMSLVGPRPERPVFVREFRSKIPHYMLRHKVKAGITGWAQVNGWRGDTSLTQRIEHDLFYIRNWSYLLDLKILTMTLWKGFVNKNAY